MTCRILRYSIWNGKERRQRDKGCILAYKFVSVYFLRLTHLNVKRKIMMICKSQSFWHKSHIVPWELSFKELKNLFFFFLIVKAKKCSLHRKLSIFFSKKILKFFSSQFSVLRSLIKILLSQVTFPRAHVHFKMWPLYGRQQ